MRYTQILYMYNNFEMLYIIEYKSYLTISVCMHLFVKRAYTHL